MDPLIFRRMQEMRHVVRRGNREGFLRGVLAPRGNNAANVQDIIQQLIDQQIRGKNDHHASRIKVDGDVIRYTSMVGFYVLAKFR